MKCEISRKPQRNATSEIRESSDVPILVISSLDVRDAALEAGADAFLSKPLDPLVFVSVIQDLLGESALVRPAHAVMA